MESTERSRRILVLDDEPDILEGVSHYLRVLKYEPIPVSQWTDALDLIAHHPPDLILLDLHMPTVRGDAILNFVRRQGHALPVVVMSAHLDQEIEAELRLLGVREFLKKPFPLKELGAILQKTLDPAPGEAPPSAARPEQPEAPRTEARPAPSERSPDVDAARGTSPLPTPPTPEPEKPRGRRRRSRRLKGKRRTYLFVVAACLVGYVLLQVLLSLPHYASSFLDWSLGRQIQVEEKRDAPGKR
jgi:CheY-like chemotaxis protein